MSSTLKPFLEEFLDQVMPFNKKMSHIHITRTDQGEVKAAAPSSDRALDVWAYAKTDIPELKGNACLGSINYLKQVFRSSFSNEMDMELNFDKARRGDFQTLRTIRFRSGTDVDLLYQATDPTVGQILKPRKDKTPHWPVAFVMDEETSKKYKEVKQIGASGSNSNTGVFELHYGNGMVYATFGDKGHQSTLVLADNEEQLAVEDGTKSFSNYFETDAFMRMIMQDEMMAVSFSDGSLKFDYETENAYYIAYMYARRLAEKQ